MTLAEILQQYGYPIVFVGALAEGETVLGLAGLAVHRGYLAALPVVVLATLGGFIGDQALFVIGRHYGHRIVERFPRLAKGTERVMALIDRHPDAAILAVRFLYGLRIAGPVAIGMSRVHWLRFAVLNFASASAWGALFVALGYALGQAVERFLGRIERVEEWALAGLVTAAVAVFLIRQARRRRATNRGSC